LDAGFGEADYLVKLVVPEQTTQLPLLHLSGVQATKGARQRTSTTRKRLPKND
jgi:hypothetical protein